MENESAKDILEIISKIKGPLKKIILEHIPNNILLKLCQVSRKRQEKHGLSFNTYKYYNLLKRKISIIYNDQLKTIINLFKIHNINFPVDQLTNVLLFKRVIDFTKKNCTIRLSELSKAIEIYLLDYPVSYLLLTNQNEYELYLKFHSYLKKTLLFCIIEEKSAYSLNTVLKNRNDIAENIIYIQSTKNDYCLIDCPNLMYLSLTRDFLDNEIDNFNYYSKKLELALIDVTTKEYLLNSFDLSSIKHLAIKSESLSAGTIDYLSNHSFNELVSLSIITSEKAADNQNKYPTLILNSSQYPKLKHLYIKTNLKLNITYEDMKLSTVVLQANLVRSVKYPSLNNLTLLNISKIESKIIERGNYENLSKLKLKQLFPIEGIVLPNITHINLEVTDTDILTLKPLIEMVRKSLISLTLNLKNIKNCSTIYNIFFASFPNVKRIKIIFPMELEETVYKYIAKYINMNNLTKIHFIFHEHCIDITSWNIIDKLLKNSFPVLETLICINILEALKLVITKNIPSLKKIECKLKYYEDIFDSFEDVYSFFKKPHPKLECLIINNLRFNVFVNYSLRKYPNLISYKYNYLTDGMLTPSPCIMRNSIFEDPQCIIF